MRDPPNVRELIEKFPHSNPEKIFNYTQKVLPGWILDTAPQFSLELAKYNYQWASTCVQLSTTPQRVILVENAFLEYHATTHTLVKEAIRRLCENGFIVIDTHNFSRCQQCGEVIVSEEAYKKRNYSFSGKCQGCFKYDITQPLPK